MLDSKVACEVGVNAAIIFENIVFWIRKNLANGVNIHDGNVWTYNSIAAFEELFPFLTYKQIRLALNKLEESDLITVGNYNRLKFDKTKWYALTSKGQKFAELLIPDDVESLKNYYHGEEMEETYKAVGLPKKTNMSAQKGKPIPDIKPDSKQIKEIYTKKNEEIVSYLNSKAQTNYKATTNKTKSLIHARLQEGFSVDDFKRVIDVKCNEWLQDKEMHKYLRPETLFGTKFESYLNQKGGSEQNEYDYSIYD